MIENDVDCFCKKVNGRNVDYFYEKVSENDGDGFDDWVNENDGVQTLFGLGDVDAFLVMFRVGILFFRPYVL